MRKKALLKTVFDILKIISITIGIVAIIGILLILLLVIPLWVADFFGVPADFDTAILLYGIECVVLFVVPLIVSGIRKLYLKNLEELSPKEP